MSSKRRREHLAHILGATRQALLYVDGMSREDFLVDKRTQQAVIMNLLIAGEASARLIRDDAAFIAQHRDIPWLSMRGMRNRIAHGYFDIDLDVVWNTVSRALPDLENKLGIIIALSEDHQK